MATNQSQRPLFYENQYLSADDLNEVVTYERVQQERHVLGAHSWGIAMGLQLKAKTAPNGQIDMYIQPGYGWDGFGRPIVILSPYKLSPALFAPILPDGSPNGQQVPVWLRYASSETQGPRPGFAVCEPQDQNSRIQELFQVEVGERPSLAAQRDGVLLAGRTVDAQNAFQRFDPDDPFVVFDASIPFQTFPGDDDQKRWLLPLGVVRWQPNSNSSLPGTFLPLTDADQQRSLALRTASGVVAGYVLAVDGRIRMRDRRAALSNVASDDLVWIEGNLRVDFDINLFHGQLSFFDAQGNDEGTPLAIQRLEDNGRGGKDLVAVIGQPALGSQAQGKNCFAVGPLDANFNPQEVFVVRDDGKVGIGTTTPLTALHMPEQGLQIGISPTAADNFYISSDLNGGPGSSGPGPRGLRFYNGNYGSGSASNPPAPLLTVLSGGNVGIGTANPGAALQVTTHLAVGPFSATQNIGGIDVTGPVAELSFARRSLTSWPTSPAPGDRFVWYNQDGNARLWTEVRGDLLTVTNNGFVGIGTTAPGEALEINGRIKLNVSAGALFVTSGTENLRAVRGTVNADGTVVNGNGSNGNGFSIDHQGGSGIYKIHFSPTFPSAPSGSVTQIFYNGGGGGDTRDNAVIIEITNEHATLKTGDSTGNASDRSFTFFFAGPNL